MSKILIDSGLIARRDCLHHDLALLRLVSLLVKLPFVRTKREISIRHICVDKVIRAECFTGL